MTPEQINKTIAELCGYEPPTHPDTIEAAKSVSLNLRSKLWLTQNGVREYALPDYFSDLNAIQEAVFTLNNEESAAFCDELAKIADQEACYTTRSMAYACATAPQRCEAFLRVKGKWE